MLCRANELRCKDVISLRTGCRIGCVCDFEIDIPSARVTALIIYGPWRFFGLLGRGKDFVIRWEDIQLIGEDAILVNFEPGSQRRRRGRRKR